MGPSRFQLELKLPAADYCDVWAANKKAILFLLHAAALGR